VMRNRRNFKSRIEVFDLSVTELIPNWLFYLLDLYVLYVERVFLAVPRSFLSIDPIFRFAGKKDAIRFGKRILAIEWARQLLEAAFFTNLNPFGH